MSSSIAIPSRQATAIGEQSPDSSMDSTSSSLNRRDRDSSNVVPVAGSEASLAKRKGKGRASDLEREREISREMRDADEKLQAEAEMWNGKRGSLLGSSLSQSEHTVITMDDDEDGQLRLLTFLKASQGFDWNQDIFLSSHHYRGHRRDFSAGSELERRPDPVEDIVLTEEEMAGMFPA